VADAKQVGMPEFLRSIVEQTLIDILTGETAQVQQIQEADSALTKPEIEQIVRRVLKSELDDGVVRLLKKELKSGSFDDLVTGITSRALAKFFEIMLTRRSTWQNQLKSK